MALHQSHCNSETFLFCAVSLWPAEETDWTERLYQVEEEEEMRASQALLWAEKYCKQTSLFTDISTERSIGPLAMHNVSHPCYSKFRVRILLGYLKRRYKMSGKVLWLGCEKGAQKYHRLGNLNREFKLHCVFPTPAALKIMLKKFEKKSFDLIFINQEAIKYSFDEFQVVMPMLIKYLNVQKGTLLMNGIVLLGQSIDSVTWKFLIYLKAFQDIDSAVGAFDNGILILRLQNNPYLFFNDSKEIEVISHERHEFRYVSESDHFFQIADLFLPVLDFLQMHEWLSITGGTVKFTSIPWDKTCLPPPNFKDDANAALKRSRPEVVCDIMEEG
jgi:hypothetical protein